MNEIKIKKVILYRVNKLKEKKIKNQEKYLSNYKIDIDLIRQIDEILSDEINFLIGLSQNLNNL